MNNCNICGGAIFPAGTAYGYAGPVCPYGGSHPTYGQHQVSGNYTFTPTPLTADDVRRIVREEIERAAPGKTAAKRNDNG